MGIKIMGMNKTEVMERFPILKQYQKENDFVTTAYRVLIDKIIEGLNIEDCKILARERLDFSLLTALSLVEDFKKGALKANYRLDEAIRVLDYALKELKKFFYTPKTYHRISRNPMLIADRTGVSKVIWLMTRFYVYPHLWTHLVNEIIEDKIVYVIFYYTEHGSNRFVRVNLHDYKIYKKQLLNLKIVNENQEKEIINIVNSHFGTFKISSVFATEEIGDRLIIYPTRNRQEKVEMNLFTFEDQQKRRGE
jgi:hypothetical protein